MVKTPTEPINELIDTIEEDTNVTEEVVEVQEKEKEETEDLNTEKDDIAKIIEEESNKSEEDKKVICLDTGIVYEIVKMQVHEQVQMLERLQEIVKDIQNEQVVRVGNSTMIIY